MKNLTLILAVFAILGCQSSVVPEQGASVPPNKRVLSITSTTPESDLPQVLLPGLELKVFAGSGKAGYKDGPALEAEFYFPVDLTRDQEGNFYIVDRANFRIRKIDSHGQVTTLAGAGETAPQRNKLEHLGKIGPFSDTEFYQPEEIQLMSENLMLVNDGNKVFQLDLHAQISTFFTEKRKDFSKEIAYGKLYTEPLITPIDVIRSIGVNHDRIYLGRGSDILYFEKRTDGYYLDIYAGNQNAIGPNHDFAETYFSDGPADQAIFNEPVDLGFDSQGNLYVADVLNHRIRKVDAQTQRVSTLSGQGVLSPLSGTIDQQFEGRHKDGPVQEALFDYPSSLAVLDTDQLLVCDSGESLSLRWIKQGQVKTIIQNFGCGKMFQAADTLYLTDLQNHQIYTLDLNQLQALAPNFFTQEFS